MAVVVSVKRLVVTIRIIFKIVVMLMILEAVEMRKKKMMMVLVIKAIGIRVSNI